MLEQIILILVKGLIVPLILEILKNKPDRGEKPLLAILRIAFSTFVGTLLAGFISGLVEIIFNTNEIELNSLLGFLLVIISATFVWLIVNRLTRNLTL